MRYYLNIGLGLLLSLLLLEVLFRCLPVNSGVRMQDTSIAQPYSRYVPQQAFTYSYGWSLLNAHAGRINRDGFFNSPDFAGQGGTLVVGDSFIEAFMLPYRDTLQGQLDAALGGNVHAAAASSNGLADTVSLTRYFAWLRPQTVVVFVKPYEMAKLEAPAPEGHNGFVRKDGRLAIVHRPYHESRLKTWLIRSALVRYVYYNLKLPVWLKEQLTPPWRTVRDAAPSDAQKAEVMRFYMGELRRATAGSRLIFVVDGDRASLYAGKRDQHALAQRHNVVLFKQLAEEKQIELIDMEPIFQQDWVMHHQRLDYLPVDAHWNAVGHRLAAAAVLQRLRAPH